MAIGTNGPSFPNVPSHAATAFTSETGFAKIRKNPEPEDIARWTEVQELRRSPVIRGSAGQVNSIINKPSCLDFFQFLLQVLFADRNGEQISSFFRADEF
jgi:hypothetical protein